MHDFVYDNDTAQVTYTYGEIETALKCCYSMAAIYNDSAFAKDNAAERYIIYYESIYERG